MNTDELKFDDLTLNELDAALLSNELDIAAMDYNHDGIIAGMNPITNVVTIIDAPEVRVVRMGANQSVDYIFNESVGVNATILQGSMSINILTLDERSTNNVRIIQQ